MDALPRWYRQACVFATVEPSRWDPTTPQGRPGHSPQLCAWSGASGQYSYHSYPTIFAKGSRTSIDCIKYFGMKIILNQSCYLFDIGISQKKKKEQPPKAFWQRDDLLFWESCRPLLEIVGENTTLSRIPRFSYRTVKNWCWDHERKHSTIGSSRQVPTPSKEPPAVGRCHVTCPSLSHCPRRS